VILSGGDGILGLFIFLLFVVVVSFLDIAKEAVIVVMGMWIPFALYMVISGRLEENDELTPYTVLRKTLGKTIARLVLICLLVSIAVGYIVLVYQQFFK